MNAQRRRRYGIRPVFLRILFCSVVSGVKVQAVLVPIPLLGSSDVTVDEGFEQFVPVPGVLQSPLEGPNEVVKDVLHAVVAFKHHLLDVVGFPSAHDEFPLGLNFAGLRVEEEAHLFLSPVHQVHHLKKLVDVLFNRFFMNEGELEKRTLLIGFKNAARGAEFVFELVDVAPFFSATRFHERRFRSQSGIENGVQFV